MKTLLTIKTLTLTLAMLACFSAPGQACTFVPNANMDEAEIMLSGYENWGVYEWNASSGQWLKVTSGYHPYFETESARPGDVPVPPDTFGGDAPIHPNGAVAFDAQDLAGAPCGVLPVTVVAAPPSSFGGSSLTLIFRRGGGGSQPSISAAALPAPATAAPITCSDEPAVRSENARHAASHYGMARFSRQKNRTITIQWSTGTVETYRDAGFGGGTGWMQPVPGTCRDR